MEFFSWFSKDKRPTKAQSGIGGLAYHTRAGIAVTIDNAIKVPALFQARKLICESIAQLPIKVTKQVDKNGKKEREAASSHWLTPLLTERPNSFDTPYEFIEQMLVQVLDDGTAYALITREEKTRKVLEILPLPSGSIEVIRDKTDVWKISYKWKATQVEIPRDNLFILKGLAQHNKLGGTSHIEAGVEAIGLTAELAVNQALQVKKGNRISGILTTLQSLAQSATDRIKKNWEANSQALADGGVAVLDSGLKFEALAQTNQAAQTMEQRSFQVLEIARLYNIPPFLLMHDGKTSSYSSVEQAQIAFLKYTLMPFVVRIEQAIKRDLLANEEGIYVNIPVNAFLRSTPRERAEYFVKAIQNGWMTRNEVRALEDLPSDPLLDEFLQPLNMTTPSDAKEEANNESTI